MIVSLSGTIPKSQILCTAWRLPSSTSVNDGGSKTALRRSRLGLGPRRTYARRAAEREITTSEITSCKTRWWTCFGISTTSSLVTMSSSFSVGWIGCRKTRTGAVLLVSFAEADCARWLTEQRFCQIYLSGMRNRRSKLAEDAYS